MMPILLAVSVVQPVEIRILDSAKKKHDAAIKASVGDLLASLGKVEEAIRNRRRGSDAVAAVEQIKVARERLEKQQRVPRLPELAAVRTAYLKAAAKHQDELLAAYDRVVASALRSKDDATAKEMTDESNCIKTVFALFPMSAYSTAAILDRSTPLGRFVADPKKYLTTHEWTFNGEYVLRPQPNGQILANKQGSNEVLWRFSKDQFITTNSGGFGNTRWDTVWSEDGKLVIEGLFFNNVSITHEWRER